jgi:hypothetical protein
VGNVGQDDALRISERSDGLNKSNAMFGKIGFSLFLVPLKMFAKIHALIFQFPALDDGFTSGRLTFFNLSRTMSARSKSRSSAESLSENCFCK